MAVWAAFRTVSRACSLQNRVFRIFESLAMPIDFKGRAFAVGAWEQKSCGMNRCLSLVHLTSRYGAMA